MSLRASLTQVAAGTVGLLKTRLELFSLEAASEKARIVRTLGLALAALLFLTLAVLVFSILVAVYFWPTDSRYLALGALAVVYGVIGVVLLLTVRHTLLNDPIPFSATVAELGQDVELMVAGRGTHLGTHPGRASGSAHPGEL